MKKSSSCARSSPPSRATAPIWPTRCSPRAAPVAALNEYQRALQASPQSPVILNKLGRVMIEQNRPEEALPLLKKALDIDPDNSNTYVQLGRGYHTDEKFQRSPQRARGSDPDQSVSSADLPFTRRSLRRPRGRRKSALRLKPHWTDSWRAQLIIAKEERPMEATEIEQHEIAEIEEFADKRDSHARRDPQGHRRPGPSHRRSFDRSVRPRPLSAWSACRGWRKPC